MRAVCVVDDDDGVRDSMRALLESHGFAVIDFNSAASFLAGVQGETFECLLLDLHMPGMSGLELQELLQRRGSHVPAILITGRNDSPLAGRIARAGFAALLQKPVSDERLLLEIRRACSSKLAG